MNLLKLTVKRPGQHPKTFQLLQILVPSEKLPKEDKQRIFT